MSGLFGHTTNKPVSSSQHSSEKALNEDTADVNLQELDEALAELSQTGANEKTDNLPKDKGSFWTSETDKEEEDDSSDDVQILRESIDKYDEMCISTAIEEQTKLEGAVSRTRNVSDDKPSHEKDRNLTTWDEDENYMQENEEQFDPNAKSSHNLGAVSIAQQGIIYGTAAVAGAVCDRAKKLAVRGDTGKVPLQWIGVAFDQPIGSGSGTVKGVTYFRSVLFS